MVARLTHVEPSIVDIGTEMRNSFSLLVRIRRRHRGAPGLIAGERIGFFRVAVRSQPAAQEEFRNTFGQQRSQGAEAYQQHTGEALDPSLIKAEDPV
jgi:hypothetical protein